MPDYRKAADRGPRGWAKDPWNVEFYRLIGKRIKHLRTQLTNANGKPMSQTALAARAGMTLSHLSKVELGTQRFFGDELVRLAQALVVTCDELLPRGLAQRNEMWTRVKDL